MWLQFAHVAASNDFDVLAYCFMPDHLHLLVKGKTQDADLRVFVSTAKQRAAYVARTFIRGRLWQPGYFDRILRDEDDAYAVIKYIRDNPVRAGLVQAADDYPFSGGTRL